MDEKEKSAGSTSGEAESEDFEAFPYPGKGFKIGEYTIIDTLGHGSMATVFLATDATGHEVALKVFQQGPGVSKTMLERFRREAEASKKLRRHPNIITIYATGKEGPYHYIAMESVKGRRTLEDTFESTPLSLGQTISLVIKILRALHYAHGKKVVHRDVKPANIMVDEFGEPLLTDFGVAALFDWPSCTVTGALTGTPLYMSPEQATGDTVGPASDIYSMGIVLYESLTGVLPYTEGRSSPVQAVLEAVKNQPPRRPRIFRKDISADLEAVVLKAIAKDPRERYVDAETFAIDLERILLRRPVSARHFGPMDRVQYVMRAHRGVVNALAAATGLALLLVVLANRQVENAKFEGLLHLARLKNAGAAAILSSEKGNRATGAPRAWHEIRRARQAMMTADWEEASRGFQSAIHFSSDVGDQRTMAIARLDQARCEAMLDHYELALDLYKWIVRNQDTSPAIAHMAQLEYLALSMLKNRKRQGLKALLWRLPPEDGPVREAMNCLKGDVATDSFYAGIGDMPLDFRNDARFAAAIAYHVNGDKKKAARALRSCIRYSRPPAEWPAPMAKQVYAKLEAES